MDRAVYWSQHRRQEAFLFKGFAVFIDWTSLAHALRLQKNRDTLLMQLPLPSLLSGTLQLELNKAGTHY
jgi:hypothetical protein